jgi:hypothetical protein
MKKSLVVLSLLLSPIAFAADEVVIVAPLVKTSDTAVPGSYDYTASVNIPGNIGMTHLTKNECVNWATTSVATLMSKGIVIFSAKCSENVHMVTGSRDGSYQSLISFF